MPIAVYAIEPHLDHFAAAVAAWVSLASASLQADCSSHDCSSLAVSFDALAALDPHHWLLNGTTAQRLSDSIAYKSREDLESSERLVASTFHRAEALESRLEADPTSAAGGKVGGASPGPSGLPRPPFTRPCP